ncbi:MAG: hypothetical protein WEB62_07090 [Bacteroidota bacterium]
MPSRFLKHSLQGLLLGLALLWSGTAIGQTPSRSGFIFIPFEDRSGFEGKWNVGTDVPRFLAAYVKERFAIPTVSPLVVRNYLEETGNRQGSTDHVLFWVDLYRRFRIRYLIAGAVELFEVNRFMTGQPLLGGYEAFKGETRITFRVYDLDRTAVSASPAQILKGEADGDFSDRSLSMTLFGKPSDRTMEFRDLDRISFGSEEFNHTVIGQALFKLGERFSLELESAMPAIKIWSSTSPDSLLALVQALDTLSLLLKQETLRGLVIFIEGASAFINLGSEDGMRVGQKVKVYKEASSMGNAVDQVGELEITDVRGPHLSLARIVSGDGAIRKNDAVFTIVTR